MFNENEVIHKKTTIVKSERQTLDNQIFVCPVCKSEGIFSSLQKAEQHISEFHQLPFDIVPQIRTLYWQITIAISWKIYLSIFLIKYMLYSIYLGDV